MTLETPRLILRPPTLADAPRVAELAGSKEVAATTLLIPHPYPPEAAVEWLTRVERQRAAGEGHVFCITPRDEPDFVGMIGLHVQPQHAAAEMGYWLAAPYWNRGYVTEAARAVLDYAFDSLGLRRVYAHHFHTNPASGRILQKIGMTFEGCLRAHILKWGEPMDLLSYGILATDPR